MVSLDFLAKCGEHTILPDVAAVVVNVLELAEGLDDEDVLACPCHNHLGSLVQTVIQDLQGLEDVAPVLPFVVETLIYHVHDLVELG